MVIGKLNYSPHILSAALDGTPFQHPLNGESIPTSCTMVVTNDINLPTEEELTVPEINLSGPALRAASFHLGKACEYQNNVSTDISKWGTAVPSPTSFG